MDMGRSGVGTDPINAFLRDYSKEVEEGNAAIFVGAGLSIPAGFVDWRNLLKTFAQDIGLDIEKEHNLVAVAQYYCNERFGNRSDISRVLLEEFTEDTEPTVNHRILVRLPIFTYWTTNYDKLIEQALEDIGKRADVKYNIEQLAMTLPRRDAVIYKMHGDISNPDETVLIKDDYERYHLKSKAFITALTGDLISKTFLFIGFSFSDPNIDYVLSRVRAGYVKNMRSHYCMMKLLDEKDYPDAETLAYRRRQQELFIGDLKRFNINTVPVTSYEQVAEVLGRLERNHKIKSILISGAAQEWGAWPMDRAREFIRGISKSLVKEEYRVISGFGRGVGSAVISGALEQIYSQRRSAVADQLILRPFPRSSAREIEWPEYLRKYRDDLTDYAGACVVLFGNKSQDGQIVLSDGVAQEFDMAKEKGAAVIPVGATGYMAKELWNKVMGDLGAYYPKRTDEFRPLLEVLGKPDAEPEVLIDTIVATLDLWAQC